MNRERILPRRYSNAYRVYGWPPRPQRPNHIIHAILTFFTAGLWLPVWVIVTINVHTRNTRAIADYWSRIRQYHDWERAQGG